MFRYFIVTAFLLCLLNNTRSQNLFANPGLEDLNICTEFSSTCAPEAWFYIPSTVYNVRPEFAQRPVKGRMFLLVPMANVLPAFSEKKRYVYTMLACPLVKGEKYSLSFYINAGPKLFERLDFYFPEEEPTMTGLNGVNITPTFSITEKHVDAVEERVWYHAKHEFTATANSKYCVIGNFSSLRRVFSAQDAMSKSGDIFYFVDEMSLKPLSGDTLCAGYKNNIRKAYAQNYRHTDNVTIEERRLADTITIPAVLFDLNSAVIKPEIGRILDSVINRIRDKKIAKIEISGHSDNTGTVAANDALSLARAVAVKKYMNDKLPPFSKQFVVAGKGQSFPIAGNETESGRQKNRRVEIVLHFADPPK